MPTKTRQGKNQVTLARGLSKLGIASRSQAADLIRQGRVKVDGEIIRSPDVWVDLKNERVALDDRNLRSETKIYLAFNKPAGVVTTRVDELGRKTIYEFLPTNGPRVFPIGRLDKETSGLLLLTNDTRFGERLTNPVENVPKTYEAVLDKNLNEFDRAQLQLPMTLHDGTVLIPAVVETISVEDNRWSITIREGKNRQIRRMFAQLGYLVVHLKRLSIGTIVLGDLKEGETRPLHPTEVALIV